MSVPENILKWALGSPCRICGTDLCLIEGVAYRKRKKPIAACSSCRCQRVFWGFLHQTQDHYDVWIRPHANRTGYVDETQVRRSEAGQKGFQTRMERGIYPMDMSLGDALAAGFAMMRLR